jgi:sec-independent protein translocase protein TatA
VSKTEKSNPSENVEEVVADPDDADVKVASSAK